jgi:hypothetical protein
MGRKEYIDFSIEVNFQVTIIAESKNEFTKKYTNYNTTIPQSIRNDILNKYITDMMDILTFVDYIDKMHITWDGLTADVQFICKGVIDDCFDADDFHYQSIKNWINGDIESNSQKFTFNFTKDFPSSSKSGKVVYEKINIDYCGEITDFSVNWL